MNLHADAVHVLLGATATAATVALLLVVWVVAGAWRNRPTRARQRPEPPTSGHPVGPGERPGWVAVALAAVRAR